MGLSGAGAYWARQHGYVEVGGYLSDALNCLRCGGRLPVQQYQGNPRKWCSESCRVAAAKAARRAAGPPDQ